MSSTVDLDDYSMAVLICLYSNREEWTVDSFKSKEKAKDAFDNLIRKGLILKIQLGSREPSYIINSSGIDVVQLHAIALSKSRTFKWSSYLKQALNNHSNKEMTDNANIGVVAENLSDDHLFSLVSLLLIRKALDLIKSYEAIHNLLLKYSVLDYYSFAASASSEAEVDLLTSLIKGAIHDIRPFYLQSDLISIKLGGNFDFILSKMDPDSNYFKSFFKGLSTLRSCAPAVDPNLKKISDCPQDLSISLFTAPEQFLNTILFGMWSHTLIYRSLDYLALTSNIESTPHNQFVHQRLMVGCFNFMIKASHAIFELAYTCSLFINKAPLMEECSIIAEGYDVSQGRTIYRVSKFDSVIKELKLAESNLTPHLKELLDMSNPGICQGLLETISITDDQSALVSLF